MATGMTYTYEYERTTLREKALEQVRKNRIAYAEKQKLVDAGKARWVKIPILRGFKLRFELIENEK